MAQTIKLTILVMGLLFGISSSLAKISTSVDQKTRLKSWFITNGNFHFELSQRLPDQTRAFLLARGFNTPAADFVAKQCLFKTVLKHMDKIKPPTKIVVNLSKWEIKVGQKFHRVRTREYWKTALDNQFKLKDTSKLALYWALYPTVNNVHPNDYNWGFTSYGLPPGAKFNLKVFWNYNNKEYASMIKNIECAPDKRKL